VIARSPAPSFSIGGDRKITGPLPFPSAVIASAPALSFSIRGDRKRTGPLFFHRR
jgi:hypothetical protein